MPRVSRACPSLWSNSSALSMSAAVIQDHGEGQGGGGGAYFSAATVLRWDIQQNFPAYGEDLLVGFVALKSG